MSDEDRLVNLVVGGERAITVSMKLLRINMHKAEAYAKLAGKKTGQPISEDNPHSFDYVAARTTVETTELLNKLDKF